MHKRRYNLRADLPDRRDRLFRVARPQLAVLPPKVDLTSECSPVFDQGQEGSCTANAWTGLFEFLELKELKSSGGPEVFAGTFQSCSRQFLYYNERLLEGDPEQDGGAMLRTGAKALARFGLCEEDTWPYSMPYPDKPDSDAYVQASKHRIGKYHRILDVQDMQQCLASGYPFVFGTVIYPSFENVGSDGIVPMPSESQSPLGGHALMCVGYESVNGAMYFRVRNSWGPGFGLGGYCLMPEGYLSDSGLTSDLWTATK